MKAYQKWRNKHLKVTKLSNTKNNVTMEQFLQLLHRLNTNKPVMEPNNNQDVNLSKKHNHNNYTKWSKLMHLVISGRGRLNHIIVCPPTKTNQDYMKRAQFDSIVISWILENVELEFSQPIP